MSDTKEMGSRKNEGKPLISLVLEAPDAIAGCARILEFGTKKYQRGNWKKGLPYTQIVDSMQRHILALINGEDLDPETQLPHADHILCNALFLSQMMHTRPDMDDRIKPLVPFDACVTDESSQGPSQEQPRTTCPWGEPPAPTVPRSF